MGKDKKEETKGFSGNNEDWPWFKAKLLASAASKKNQLDEWMDTVDENVNDSTKWTVINATKQTHENISDETNKKLFNLLVKKLDVKNTTIIASKYRNKGQEAWAYLLRKYEARRKTEGGAILLSNIASMTLEQFGTSECEEYTGALEMALCTYARTTGKVWLEDDKKGFLLAVNS